MNHLGYEIQVRRADNFSWRSRVRFTDGLIWRFRGITKGRAIMKAERYANRRVQEVEGWRTVTTRTQAAQQSQEARKAP